MADNGAEPQTVAPVRDATVPQTHETLYRELVVKYNELAVKYNSLRRDLATGRKNEIDCCMRAEINAAIFLALDQMLFRHSAALASLSWKQRSALLGYVNCRTAHSAVEKAQRIGVKVSDDTRDYLNKLCVFRDLQFAIAGISAENIESLLPLNLVD